MGKWPVPYMLRCAERSGAHLRVTAREALEMVNHYIEAGYTDIKVYIFPNSGAGPNNKPDDRLWPEGERFSLEQLRQRAQSELH